VSAPKFAKIGGQAWATAAANRANETNQYINILLFIYTKWRGPHGAPEKNCGICTGNSGFAPYNYARLTMARRAAGGDFYSQS
jgi:hypothetical protein